MLAHRVPRTARQRHWRRFQPHPHRRARCWKAKWGLPWWWFGDSRLQSHVWTRAKPTTAVARVAACGHGGRWCRLIETEVQAPEVECIGVSPGQGQEAGRLRRSHCDPDGPGRQERARTRDSADGGLASTGGRMFEVKSCAALFLPCPCQHCGREGLHSCHHQRGAREWG